MRRSSADLQDIIDAVEIHSADSFSVGGQRFDAPTQTSPVADVTERLGSALYQHKYCRPQRPAFTTSTPDGRAARLFVERLSEANSGTGTWEPGWIVDAIEVDGTLVVRRMQDDLMLWARPDQFRAQDGTTGVGAIGRVRLSKERRELLRGYYAAFGDADAQPDEGSPGLRTVRFYWHLTAESAPVWIRELTARLNTAAVPFHCKTLSDPAAYLRADAGVLYVARQDVARTLDLLPDIHGVVSNGMRAATPMFTRRLARGLAVAEDPGDGRSFGQHRCHLVADALVEAFRAGAGSNHRMEAVAARFAAEGLSIDRPWLGAGSRQRYAWPTRRTPARRLEHA